MGALISSAGGRRFVLTVSAGSVATLLVWFTKIDPATWRDVVIATVGIYIAGNTTQKIKAPAGEG